PICERLVAFRAHHRVENPTFHNAPVPSWLSGPDGQDAAAVRLLVVGLAPGLKGANRTARPFTGDWAGDLLYATLTKFGFAKGAYGADPTDGLELVDCGITNAVRCVPPQNKPVGAEINACRPFLVDLMERLPNLSLIVTLGKISHDSTLRALKARVAAHPFAHAAQFDVAGTTLLSSYHCSRYNTNTGRLTEAMFEDVFSKARALLQAQSPG
ncbi:MAG: uracil-DNA glycosylase, partial [Pseudomonadota bacterium]